ncbi:MAG TPA: membrane protein insertase YidC [Rhodothermales bacterium]|nr:membrane protein insertase YidC [Rhodothermales bacterium]
MDRNVVIATVLIGLIMFVWLYFLTPPPQPQPVGEEQAIVDTQVVAQPEPEIPQDELVTAPQTTISATDSVMAAAQEGEAQLITVDSDLYQAQFSTKGGTLVSFVLKEYFKFDQETPVQLVDSSAAGALSMVFTTPTSHLIDTRTLFFEPSFNDDTLRVTEAGASLSFETKLGSGTIRQTYTFTPEEYDVGLRIEQINPSAFQTDDGYELAWNGALPFTESATNRKEEAIKLGAYARSGGEVEGIALDSDTFEEMTLRGDVSWIAVKNKYFTATVMPETPAREAELVGERFGELDDPGLRESYRASLLMPAPTAEADEFTMYLGPLEFYRISKFDRGLYGMVDYGWDAFAWMTRPLAKFIFIPFFTFLSGFISNFGLVIIIFAITIKMLLYPLTKTSYRSMARMRELQPLMQEIKEKYADDPQKQQEATMKMYREQKVNPLGGCLPMLLQYPIIIALWQFLQQSIEIRQQGFLWANDLSAPDVILNLPFTIPFYGDYVAGFTLLMGLSLVVQMRVQATPTAGMQGKMLMYFMPIMLFVIFNSLPSGLSLYYLCYNVITAIQQKYINHQLEVEKKTEAASGNGKGSKKDARTAKLSRNGKAKKGGKKVRT